jgi:hypothetical protein
MLGHSDLFTPKVTPKKQQTQEFIHMRKFRCGIILSVAARGCGANERIL